MLEGFPAMAHDVVSADEMTTLVERYYQHVPEEELAERSSHDLRSAVESHVRLAKSRPQGTCLVNAFTPTVDEHGWDADGHIVIEIGRASCRERGQNRA